MAASSAVAKAVRLVFSGSVDELRELLSKAPEVGREADYAFNDSSPLHVAVGENEEACALAILEVCPEAVHCRDIEERTPLMHVCAGTSSELMRVLLDAGASVNAVDKGGRTSLHYAVENMAVDAVEMLLSEGADPCLTSIAGETAASLARGIQDDEDEADDDGENLVLRNALICRSLGSRLGEENLIGDAHWEAIPDLDDHQFQATVFQAPKIMQAGAELKVELTIVIDKDDDHDSDAYEEYDECAGDTVLREAVVDAQLIEVCPERSDDDSIKLRVFLAQTPTDIFDIKPELLLVRGRELVVTVSARPTTIPE